MTSSRQIAFTHLGDLEKILHTAVLYLTSPVATYLKSNMHSQALTTKPKLKLHPRSQFFQKYQMYHLVF